MLFKRQGVVTPINVLKKVEAVKEEKVVEAKVEEVKKVKKVSKKKSEE